MRAAVDARHADAIHILFQSGLPHRRPPDPVTGAPPTGAPLSLDALLAIARTHNPTLRAAQAAIAESAGRARQAGMLPNPVIGYEGDQIRGGSYGGGEQGGFVQQTIPLGGKLGLRHDVYRAQQRTGELALAAQQQRVEADLESSFYAALALQQESGTRKHLAALATDAAQTARQLANVGQADAPDVLQSEVEQEQAALDTLSAQRRYIAAFHQLAATAGEPDLPLARLDRRPRTHHPRRRHRSTPSSSKAPQSSRPIRPSTRLKRNSAARAARSCPTSHSAPASNGTTS